MSDKRLIDANALLREMRHSGRAAYMLVMDAPTIDPETLRPVGHWIRREDRHDEAWDCSVCGKTVGPIIVLCSKYCLNCGAKMEE